MWEIDIAGQVFTFLYSLVGGVAFCLLFDITRILREILMPSNSVIFFMDTAYFVLIAFLEFCFFLATCNGEIRGFVFVGNIIGFVACRFTLSSLFLTAFRFVYNIADRSLRLLKKIFLMPIYRVFRNLGFNIRKNTEKYSKFIKKRLKKPDRLVYTKEKCPQDKK